MNRIMTRKLYFATSLGFGQKGDAEVIHGRRGRGGQCGGGHQVLKTFGHEAGWLGTSRGFGGRSWRERRSARDLPQRSTYYFRNIHPLIFFMLDITSCFGPSYASRLYRPLSSPALRYSSGRRFVCQRFLWQQTVYEWYWPHTFACIGN